MNTSENLTEWLRKIGYEGKIPSNFRPFCNASTALIWEQVIHTVKPKQEIAHIRNNALINNLQQKGQSSMNPNSYLYDARYTLKEIEVWNKRRNLKKRISTTEDSLDEAKAQLNSQSLQNKMKYLNLQNLREKTRENGKHIFILNTKAKRLEADTAEVEEMLALARNLTPIESEEQNKAEVFETLKKCAEKLEQIIEKQNESASQVPLSFNNTFALKTPHSKSTRRALISSKKTPTLFSSTKNSSHSAKKSKQNLDDSLGLLDDLSVTFDDALAASSFKESHVSLCYDLAVLNDQELSSLVENLLHRYNRQFVWKALDDLTARWKTQWMSAIMEVDKENLSIAHPGSNKSGGLVDLYAKHVDFELKALKVKLQVEELKRERRKLETTIAANLSNKLASPFELSNHKKLLELQRQKAGLTAAIQYMEKLHKPGQELLGPQNALQTAQEKSLNLDRSIAAKLSSIECKVGTFKQIIESMSQICSETSRLVRKLAQFTLDPSWTNVLSANLISAEIDALIDFPLEYNRLAIEKTFARDLPINHIPYQENLDSNALLILVTLLQSPWSPAETLLVDFVRAKRKLELLKMSRYVPDKIDVTGYTLEDLQCQESYINYALDKLKSLIQTESTSMQMVSQIRDTMQLWLEMPVRNFISPKRLFNGAPYEYYEKLFESFYKQL